MSYLFVFSDTRLPHKKVHGLLKFDTIRVLGPHAAALNYALRGQ